MRVLGIDPGPDRSAAVLLDNQEILESEYGSNQCICETISQWNVHHCAIEHPTGWTRPGKAMTEPVTATIRQCGYFQCWMETHPDSPTMEFIFPPTVRAYVCQTPKAGDSEVRLALEALFGDLKSMKVSNVHMRAALAVAVTSYDMNLPDAGSKRWLRIGKEAN